MWNGNSYSAAGSYVMHFTNAARLRLHRDPEPGGKPTAFSTTNVGVCQPAALCVGTITTMPGTYTLHFTNALQVATPTANLVLTKETDQYQHDQCHDLLEPDTLCLERQQLYSFR